MERAVRERVAILARYRAASTSQTTSRVIEPGQLHWDAGLETLYLIGWCRLGQTMATKHRALSGRHRWQSCR
ncbi:MAG TPA: WYL domain-containing protein [Polyangia bacterium]